MSLRDIVNATADEVEGIRRADAAHLAAIEAKRAAIEGDFLNRIRELDGIEIASSSDGAGYFTTFTVPNDLKYWYPFFGSHGLHVEVIDEGIRFTSGASDYYGDRPNVTDYPSTDEAARELAQRLGVYAAYGRTARAKGRKPEPMRNR